MNRLRPTVVAAAIVSLCALPTGAAFAGVGECVETDPWGFCVEWDVPTPGGPGTPGGNGGGGDDVRCYWVNLDEDLAEDDPTVYYDWGLDYPPEGVEIVWQEWVCSDGRTTFDFRWIIPPTPANLASIARGRLVGRLPQPVVESSPPTGTPSIVGVPVFVAVANWTGIVTEAECAGGLCVTVTATPALRFTPGQPDAAPVDCAGSGSRYVPGGEVASVQAAAPGACTFTYALRTGAAGRPSEWPGEVSVTWVLGWTASSGATGSLPSVTRTTAVPRAVSEVQTVVVGGATP